MHAVQGWRKAVTRSWPGSVVLFAAFLVHLLLALRRIAQRLTWKLPLWEAAQIASGLAIPLFLITHVVYNRGAASLAGTDDTYAWELAEHLAGAGAGARRAPAVRVGARLHRHRLLAEPGAVVPAGAAGPVRARRGAAGGGAGGLLRGGPAGGSTGRRARGVGRAAGCLARAGRGRRGAIVALHDRAGGRRFSFSPALPCWCRWCASYAAPLPPGSR